MNDQTRRNPIRLLLLDQFALFRASLGRFLASEPGFEVVGECGTCREALEILKSAQVDVILFDFDADSEHGDDFISAARQAGYEGHFLVVTGVLDMRKSALALKLGATGVFLKSDALERLLQAIQLVANGEVWMDQKVLRLLAEQFFFPFPRADAKDSLLSLGERERNVLEGIVRGLTNRKIGDNMGLSESSVKNIVQRLFGMTGVKTRGQLVRVALEGSFIMGEFGNRTKEILSANRRRPEGPHQLVGANLLTARQSNVRQSNE